jgi:hypothetical protein
VPSGVDLGPAPVAAPVALGEQITSLAGPRIGAKLFKFEGRGGSQPLISLSNRPDRNDSVITVSQGAVMINWERWSA